MDDHGHHSLSLRTLSQSLRSHNGTVGTQQRAWCYSYYDSVKPQRCGPGLLSDRGEHGSRAGLGSVEHPSLLAGYRARGARPAGGDVTSWRKRAEAGVRAN